MTKTKLTFRKASTPTRGSFYLLGSTVYYNTDGEGIGHPDLWKLLVPVAFPGLPLELRLELKNAVYGADRGRVTWTGELVDGEPSGKGQFILFGTPACTHHEQSLKELFGLVGLPKAKLKIDFKTDQHYKTVREDLALVGEAFKWCKPTCGAEAEPDSLKFVKIGG